MDLIEIYCDGGCRGNGKENNIGGYGIVLLFQNRKSELSGHVVNTTNNIMELTSVIRALEKIKVTRFPVRIYLDSAYVLQGITGWIKGWKQNGWVTGNKKTPVKNKELWIELDRLVNKFPAIEFLKVKGHSGVEYNERADKLANEAMDKLEEELKNGKTSN